MTEKKEKVKEKQEKEETKLNEMEVLNTSKHKAITPLNKTNYTVWKLRMQCYLEDLNVWKEPTAEELEKDPLLEVNTRQAWREILCRVDDDHVEYIQDKTLGKAAWDKFKSMYQNTGMVSLLRKLRDLFGYSLSEEDMNDHIAVIKQQLRSLKGFGIELPETVQIAVLLNSLPASYEPMILSWEAADVKFSLEEISDKLINASKRENMQRSDNVLAKSRQLSPSDKKEINKASGSTSKYPPCTYCSKTNHPAKRCFKKKKLERQQEDKSNLAWGFFVGDIKEKLI